MSLRYIIPGGILKQDVTSITLVNNTEFIIDKTVPTDMRWILLGIKITNYDDVARTVSVIKFKEAAKTNEIKVYFSASVAAFGRQQWPNSSTGNPDYSPLPMLEILGPGNTIQIRWAAGGASSGSVDADGLVIEYLEVPI